MYGGLCLVAKISRFSMPLHKAGKQPIHAVKYPSRAGRTAAWRCRDVTAYKELLELPCASLVLTAHLAGHTHVCDPRRPVCSLSSLYRFGLTVVALTLNMMGAGNPRVGIRPSFRCMLCRLSRHREAPFLQPKLTEDFDVCNSHVQSRTSLLECHAGHDMRLLFLSCFVFPANIVSIQR